MLRRSAFVAGDASIVANLQKQRSVAVGRAAHHAPGAAYAAGFVDENLVIGVFDRSAPDGIHGTPVVFGGGDVACSRIAQKSEAEAAVSTEREGVHAFDRGWREDALPRAFAALRAFVGIDLPNGGPGRRTSGENPSCRREQRRAADARPGREKRSSRRSLRLAIVHAASHSGCRSCRLPGSRRTHCWAPRRTGAGTTQQCRRSWPRRRSSEARFETSRVGSCALLLGRRGIAGEHAHGFGQGV